MDNQLPTNLDGSENKTSMASAVLVFYIDWR